MRQALVAAVLAAIAMGEVPLTAQDTSRAHQLESAEIHMLKSRQRIIEGTVVNGDVDARILAAALDVLPRRPERMVIVETTEMPPALASLQLDGFVLRGSNVVYLCRQSQTLRAAEYSGGPYVLMLAVVIWHEMAHADGLDERQAQAREENLWKEFTGRGLVDSAVGLRYLAEMRRRR